MVYTYLLELALYHKALHGLYLSFGIGLISQGMVWFILIFWNWPYITRHGMVYTYLL